ncbi:MAG: 3-mercaptopyruvate sulfurtransferase [Paracoccus sp. (in: a-proteobacteria)]|nr:3-mercaptopyruvate sulfurtransferase [Paracoccus sp. (in: a-proteobacteria)]
MNGAAEFLVSTDWLAAHLGEADLRVLDASWHMAATGRDARAEFDAGHIPGARFFDIDAVSAPDSDLPHMAPPPGIFARALGDLGIGPGHFVVIYDDAATRSAARAWWTFDLMGWDRVAVLDGGLAKWRAEGRAISTAPVIAVPCDPPALAPRPGRLRDAAEVAAISAAGGAQILDARSAPRFRGEAPEPRPGLRAGHIPGALNLPFDRLYNPDGTMKGADALRAEFAAAGLDLTRPVVTTCGSGITAASLSLALAVLGHDNHALYDGSWTEWGANPDLKIATGEA